MTVAASSSRDLRRIHAVKKAAFWQLGNDPLVRVGSVRARVWKWARETVSELLCGSLSLPLSANVWLCCRSSHVVRS